MRRILVPFSSVVVLLLASTSAFADTLSYSFNFNFKNFSGVDENSFGVPTFDPRMGTLNSITVTLTGDVVVQGVGTYTLIAENGPTQTGSMSGPFSQQATLDIYGAAGYVGTPGFPGYRLSFFDPSTTGTLSFSSIGPVVDTYTYIYTPAATPEPSSFLLLGTGLLGTCAELRRRLRTA